MLEFSKIESASATKSKEQTEPISPFLNEVMAQRHFTPIKECQDKDGNGLPDDLKLYKEAPPVVALDKIPILPCDFTRVPQKRRALLGELALGFVIAAAGVANLNRAASDQGRGGTTSFHPIDFPAESTELAEPSEEDQSMTATLSEVRTMSVKQTTCPDTIAVPLSRPRMRLSSTDTLSKLGQELYDDEAIGWLIADINLGCLKEQFTGGKRIVSLKNRQEIELPVWRDLLRFYQRGNNKRPTVRLITVIEETQVDQATLNHGLGYVFGLTAMPPRLPA